MVMVIHHFTLLVPRFLSTMTFLNFLGKMAVNLSSIPFSIFMGLHTNLSFRLPKALLSCTAQTILIHAAGGSPDHTWLLVNFGRSLRLQFSSF